MTRRLLRCVLVGTLATAFLPAHALAQGGPPLITDDPDTPGPGYWEINIAALMEKTRSQRRVEVPRVDLNYGVGRRIQLKFEMPWVALQNEEQRTETGAGTATVGVKWRFIGQEGATIAWAIYPQLDFNTAHSSVTKGIENEGRQFLLPTEITVETFHLEINGEVGRTFVENGPGSWIFGLSTEGHVLPRLELLAELHGERVTDQSTGLIVVGGGRLKLTTTMTVLLAIGHSIRSLPDEGLAPMLCRAPAQPAAPVHIRTGNRASTAPPLTTEDYVLPGIAFCYSGASRSTILTRVAAALDHVTASEEYYGLLAHPFGLTPDLRFVYPSRSHSQAFEQVTEALKRRGGLIVITGEIGTGKTVLCRTLLETFEARTFLSVILDPSLSVGDLLQQVLTDFGLITGGEPGTRPVPEVDRHQLVSTLQRFLATLIPVGANAVIMIDEAQHLDPIVLEELRLLSNFETDDAKLLQIVLVGQPDLDQVLRRLDMRQLSQRIARRFELYPLSPSEVQDYIERRLLVATDEAKRPRGELPPEHVRFTPAAVRAVAAISRGIPRLINTVCDQALEIGFEQQRRAIDRPAVIAAAQRLKLPAPMALRLPGGASRRAAAALVLVIGALGAWWWSKRVPQTAAPPALVTPIAARATAPTLTASEAPRTQPAPPVPPPDARPPKPFAAPAAAGKPAAAQQTGGYEISVAAFRTTQRTEEVADTVAQTGLPVSTRADPTGAWHRIVVGPFNSSDEAESAQRILARQGFSGTKISASKPDGR